MHVLAGPNLVQPAVLGNLDLRDVVGLQPGPEPLGLVTEVLHQLRAHDPLGEARIVLDVGRLLEQPAPGEALDHERLQVGARRVQRCRVAGGTAPDDDHVLYALVVHFKKYSVGWR